jgi:hypothetical protein
MMRKVLLSLILVIGGGCASMVIRSAGNDVVRQGMFFNKTAFLEDAKKVHLLPGEISKFESIPDEDVRDRLDTFIDYEDNPRFSAALGEICINMVGRTMFKVLMTKLPPGSRLRIIDIGPVESGTPLIDQNDSSYLNYEVKVNLNAYDRYGVGIPSRQYYCLDVDDLSIKRKSIAGSMFHEFTRCIHQVEDAERYDLYGTRSLPDGDDLWNTKEERRTISGYIEADAYAPVDVYDPICDNCYSLYNAPNKARYYPRLGRWEYVESVHIDDSVEDFCKNPTFNLAWPLKYIGV